MRKMIPKNPGLCYYIAFLWDIYLAYEWQFSEDATAPSSQNYKQINLWYNKYHQICWNVGPHTVNANL